MAAHAAGFGHPRAMLAAQYDREGDRIGATLASADTAFLLTLHRVEPRARVIARGYGTRLIARFVRQETRRGVVMIGGLPTDFDTVRLPGSDIAAMRAAYVRNGGRFLQLPNHSRYPRADFYDSEDHLAQPCQYLHSIAVAHGLAAMLRRRVAAPSAGMRALAATCPSAAGVVALGGP